MSTLIQSRRLIQSLSVRVVAVEVQTKVHRGGVVDVVLVEMLEVEVVVEEELQMSVGDLID